MSNVCAKLHAKIIRQQLNSDQTICSTDVKNDIRKVHFTYAMRGHDKGIRTYIARIMIYEP
ncbi:hypothetical protein L484_013798 [Morus notabilis]|uniref:Uncharacterized protein n=1 Tax=Morus notabilis TaxID=981085 RepID=W9QQG4_9ROSA|nr:hypothetical protein L484_013798 [Morus notabilis]